MKKIIIFDLDGTLVSLDIDYDFIRKRLGEFFTTDDKFSPLLHTIKKLAKTDKELVSAYKIISDEEFKSTQLITVNKDLIQLLEFLKSSGYIIALVTLQDKKIAMQVLSNLSILDLFNLIITRDNSIDRLDQIQLILESFKIPPKESILVGDSENDILSAIKLGCKPVLINKKGNFKINSDILQISNLSQLMRITI